MLTQLDLEERVRAFLTNIRPDVDMTAITSHSNLAELGILDSLAVTDLIVFLEHLMGQQIVVENYQLESFHTLAGICHVVASSMHQDTTTLDADQASTAGKP